MCLTTRPDIGMQCTLVVLQTRLKVYREVYVVCTFLSYRPDSEYIVQCILCLLPIDQTQSIQCSVYCVSFLLQTKFRVYNVAYIYGLPPSFCRPLRVYNVVCRVCPFFLQSRLEYIVQCTWCAPFFLQIRLEYIVQCIWCAPFFLQTRRGVYNVECRVCPLLSSVQTRVYSVVYMVCPFFLQTRLRYIVQCIWCVPSFSRPESGIWCSVYGVPPSLSRPDSHLTSG